ncbi:hypothetical protein WD_0896 [Wolbachia endosymbiont of Drosophila melanogaster]|nr:hypothetical protein WD_0896 [Wolbachia endosymbiont of Drosophila melanogaster]ACN95581.1 hypothetical protein WRi_008470 [Wolbachia sp. wRi]KDB19900.1 hypothetical protein wGmm_0238 [Wolbachia endosymbiont of Glossina morsitans morsitans]
MCSNCFGERTEKDSKVKIKLEGRKSSASQE